MLRAARSANSKLGWDAAGVRECENARRERAAIDGGVRFMVSIGEFRGCVSVAFARGDWLLSGVRKQAGGFDCLVRMKDFGD